MARLCEMARCTLPAAFDVRVRMTAMVVSGPSAMCALCLAEAEGRIKREMQQISLQVTPIRPEDQADA